MRCWCPRLVIVVYLKSCLAVYSIVIICSHVSVCARYCSNCKKHQRGTVKQSLYRLPDILIIHIKRFNMTARFREKIRAKVDYPLYGLDMRPYTVRDGGVGSQSRRHSSIERSVGGSDRDVYDLYGVSNHIGEW